MSAILIIFNVNDNIFEFLTLQNTISMSVRADQVQHIGLETEIQRRANRQDQSVGDLRQ